MQRWMAAMLAGAMVVSALTGCEKQQSYQDGSYTAEFAEYDSRGFKDYIELTVEDGLVTAIVYDARPEEAGAPLKSEDEVYREQMQAVQNNYPQQVHSTLVNQYMVAQDLGKIDVVAGATYSTECFLALFRALEAQMYEGDTTNLIVENIPER